MARNDLGELRRSGVASQFGPGAVVDFRDGDAAISAVAAGLEEWDFNFQPPGSLNPQAIHEERLQKKLNVRAFRLPPVRNPDLRTDDEKSLVAVRFPQWLQCPECDLIGEADEWADEPGRAGRWCAGCSSKAPGRQHVYVIPVRFVMACEAGHLDEFPWHFWVGHDAECRNRRFLKLKSEEAGIAGIYLTCPDCSGRRSMDGIFSKETWRHFSNCRGRRPWLAAGPEVCTHKARAVQRGASNLYFPITESALSIPPWSDRLQEALGVFWETICNTAADQRATFIRILGGGDLRAVLDELDLSPEGLAAEIERRLAANDTIELQNLRLEEYRQFTSGVPVDGLDREFEIRPQQVPGQLSPWFSRLVKAVRLREVRALTAFTRINPPGGEDAPGRARRSVADLGWLPAVEVRGEGIFLEFEPDALAAWEVRPAVAERAAELQRRHLADWIDRYGADVEPPEPVTARRLMIHTFAHALMRQLTLDCGYSSSALRERLYVSSEGAGMSGVLIYTATTDADGTLGGLQRQGDPDRVARTVVAAIHSQAWCSSDPLCIEDMLSGPDTMSLAACHACALAPETSCEEFNRFLDRAMLVGTPNDPALGFFRAMLDGAAA